MELKLIDGKLTDHIVAPVVISGSVVDLLNSISMVSKDVHIFGMGMCGKGHKEWVFVSDGGPYLKEEKQNYHDEYRRNRTSIKKSFRFYLIMNIQSYKECK